MSMMQADPSQSTAYTATVDSVNPITRGRADLELKGYSKAFRLSLGKDWVLRPGDQVTLGVTPDTDGVLTSYIYRNDSKGVASENESIGVGNSLFLIIAGIPAMLFGALVGYVVLSTGSSGPVNAFGMFLLSIGGMTTALGIVMRKQGKHYSAILEAQREAMKTVSGEAKEPGQ